MNSTNYFSLVIVALLIFFLVGRPAMREVSMLRVQKSEYEAAIDQIKELESKRSDLVAKLNEFPAEDRKKLETFLPDKDGAIKMIADIDGIASRYGISVRTADSRESVNDTSQSVSEAKPESQYYGTRSIEITLSSNYDSLIKFLSDLEKSLRIIDIKSVDFSQSQDPKLSSLNPVNQYRISADIYWLKDHRDEK